MKKFISAALVVAMAAASCTSKEDLGNNNAPAQPSVDGTMTFSADFAEPMAKAAPSYDENQRAVAVLWEADDKVGVYAADGAPAEFTAQSAGATTTLKGSALEAETYYAMYPYDAEATIAAGVITTALPAAQVATKDEFAAHLAVASTTGTSFSFQNVCGLVRVYVGCEHVRKIEFKGNNNETVAGAITVNAATAGYEPAGAEKVITVTPPAGAETFETGAFYFSVLPQEFAEGFTVTYETEDGLKEIRQAGAVTIPRSSLVVGKAFTDIEGAGTEADPFVIKTVHDLCNLNAVLSPDTPNYIELANDIDMADVETWTPINNNRVVTEVAEVHFDGKDHAIRNFGPTTVTANSAGSTNVGIFGILSGSCKNLDIVIKESGLNVPTYSTVGVLAGFAGYNDKTTQLEATVSNVHVSGGPVIGNKVVGGFVASSTKVTFTDCSSEVDVTSSDLHVGGFVGRYDDNVVSNTFIRCFTTGDVKCLTTKKRFIGGFLGGNSGGNNCTFTFTDCYSTGNVTGDYQTGAFIGFMEYGTINITNCFATGNVSSVKGPTSAKQIAGIIGGTKGNATLTNCFYEGTISYTFKASAADSKGRNESFGGLLGLNSEGASSITNSFAIVDYDLYSDASASNWASKYVGGIIGYNKGNENNEGTVSVSNSYAQMTIANVTDKVQNVGGILGQTDATATATLTDNTYFGADASCGGGTPTDNSQKAAAAYTNASAVAAALGWSEETWNLTGATPTLKCFE